MFEIPFGYEKIAPTTWAYLSALLMLALFFKFNRFWTFRNLDLILIVLLSPGLLMVIAGESAIDIHGLPTTVNVNADDVQPQTPLAFIPGAALSTEQSVWNPSTAEVAGPSPEQLSAMRLARWGYIWLFAVGTLFLVRLLVDPFFVRRPKLEPNLSIGGLTFLGCSLIFFIIVNILNSIPPDEELAGPREAMQIVQRQSDTEDGILRHGPGLGFVHVLVVVPKLFFNEMAGIDANSTDKDIEDLFIAQTMSIVFQLGIVLSIILIGYYHFEDLWIGIGMATLHLILPYTTLFAGHVSHSLPAMLLVLSILSFRRPLLAGICIGLATGVFYYPIFLLPLWFSFYWPKGAAKFAIGLLGSLVLVVASLIFTVDSIAAFGHKLQSMFGVIWPRTSGLEGVWQLGWDAVFRIPILVAFVVLSLSYVFWPARKNLGTLIAYTAVMMVTVQFWHGLGGGKYITWYLPLALLTFFRPNLDDVTAESI